MERRKGRSVFLVDEDEDEDDEEECVWSTARPVCGSFSAAVCVTAFGFRGSRC